MIEKITILGGLDKEGSPEKIRQLDIKAGEVLAVVGPTGSGKTQLISDIEQYAEAETLTGRSVLINGQPVDRNKNKRLLRYLVAEVSQNMNFVIDMSIEEFLLMHAQVRAIQDPVKTIKDVLAITNQLSGEPVSFSTNLTQLSGGQSRALMVADVALISNAPVVLIDEIENAGIDRLQALEMLTGRGKVVLVVSHDPTLMLMAGQRVVMKNGGMDKICRTTPEERGILEGLIRVEREIARLREHLRKGTSIGTEDNKKEEWSLWQEFWCTVR
ncbi:ATP-binding cassette domain-containing protein [Desulfoscipio sp. XC116]|uniref:ATP-binding cassette domain-containing protein n=1 Tax=Desulfoscipio sp. XC116 TaxID=3144975 RepID=UPI00325BE2DD